VIDPRTHAILEDIVRREGRSLLQYVADSFPWTATDEQGALEQLRRMIEAERQATTDLVRFLVRRKFTPPYLGAYPARFTTINFVSLEYLLPRLAQEQRRDIRALEDDLVEVHDVEVREQVKKLLELKRRHLQTLEQLAVAHSAAVA
jgi:hypothetical protein